MKTIKDNIYESLNYKLAYIKFMHMFILVQTILLFLVFTSCKKKCLIFIYIPTIRTEHNGSFHLAIPIISFKPKKCHALRLRSPKYFEWEYNTGTEFNNDRYYEIRPNENRIEHFYNLNYLNKINY